MSSTFIYVCILSPDGQAPISQVMMSCKSRDAGVKLAACQCLAGILRAARSSHGVASHSKWISDPPYTLIGVINGMISDSSQRAEDRTRACISFCLSSYARLGMILITASLQITWLSMTMTLSILLSCRVPYGAYRLYCQNWLLILMLRGRRMRSLILNHCF